MATSLANHWTKYAQSGALAATAKDPVLAQGLMATLVLTACAEALSICLSVGLLPAPQVVRR